MRPQEKPVPGRRFNDLVPLVPETGHASGPVAHYTPCAHVECLVLPTVAELRRFHHRQRTVRMLDPACCPENSLSVTLEHLRRLEGKVLNTLDEPGCRQTSLGIDDSNHPEQQGNDEAVLAHDLDRIVTIDRALTKIREHTHGLSDGTGKPIARAHQEAVAEAIFTADEPTLQARFVR